MPSAKNMYVLVVDGNSILENEDLEKVKLEFEQLRETKQFKERVKVQQYRTIMEMAHGVVDVKKQRGGRRRKKGETPPGGKK